MCIHIHTHIHSSSKQATQFKICKLSDFALESQTEKREKYCWKKLANIVNSIIFKTDKLKKKTIDFMWVINDIANDTLVGKNKHFC